MHAASLAVSFVSMNPGVQQTATSDGCAATSIACSATPALDGPYPPIVSAAEPSPVAPSAEAAQTSASIASQEAGGTQSARCRSAGHRWAPLHVAAARARPDVHDAPAAAAAAAKRSSSGNKWSVR